MKAFCSAAPQRSARLRYLASFILRMAFAWSACGQAQTAAEAVGAGSAESEYGIILPLAEKATQPAIFRTKDVSMVQDLVRYNNQDEIACSFALAAQGLLLFVSPDLQKLSQRPAKLDWKRTEKVDVTFALASVAKVWKERTGVKSVWYEPLAPLDERLLSPYGVVGHGKEDVFVNRDIMISGGDDNIEELSVLATRRIANRLNVPSQVLPPEIPEKGKQLCQMWKAIFNRLEPTGSVQLSYRQDCHILLVRCEAFPIETLLLYLKPGSFWAFEVKPSKEANK